MMHGMKKSDEAVLPLKAANKGAQTPAESPEGRASTKGNSRDQSTLRTQGRDLRDPLILSRESIRRNRSVEQTSPTGWTLHNVARLG